MIDINLGNVLTIGVISALFYAGVKFGTKLAGVNLAWL